MLSGLNRHARDARAWPFEQARNLLQHLLKTRLDTDAERDLAASLIGRGKPDEAVAAFPALGRAVILETGYGPSGLPQSAPSARWCARPWCARLSAAQGPVADPAVLLLRRHGRAAQGAGQRAEREMLIAHSASR